MNELAILSLLISLIFADVVGLMPGGIIVPFYFVLFIEEPVKIACDYVVMAVGSKANAFDLDGVTVPVTCVGDCSGERTADIASAIRTAYHAANEL